MTVVLWAGGVLSSAAAFTSFSLARQSIAATGVASPPALEEVRNLVAEGRYQVAETEVRQILAAAPDQSEARFLLGLLLFKLHRPAESLAAYTEAAKYRSPSPEEFVVIASDYILLKDLGDAQRWLTLATGEAPRNTAAWYLLGRTEYNLDHPGPATQAFLQCLILEPGNLRAQYNLGLAFERLQQPEKAIEAYQRAIKLEAASAKPDPQPYLDLGILLLSQQKADQALPYLQRAVEVAPSNAKAHEEFALCLDKLGRSPEAAAEMLLCVHLAPDSAAAAFFLGRIYRHLGRTTQAKQQFARAAQLDGTQSSKEVPNPSPDP